MAMNRLCGMRLTTAGVVVGWIGAVGSLISVVILSLGLSKEDDLVSWIVKLMKEKNPNIDENIVRYALLIVLIVYLVISLINLVASSLLILGTVKERHLLLVPWLINSGISMFFNVLYTVYVFFAQLALHAPFGAVIASLIISGIGVSLQLTIWYAIYSLFKQLQTTREQQQQLLRPAGSSYPSYTKI